MCSYLNELSLSHQVFFYQMRKIGINFDECVVLDTINGDSEPNTHTNTQAIIDGYVLNSELYDLAKNYNQCPISVEDLGITIVLMNFAKYHSKAQYHLFIDECYTITELDSFESKLILCNNSFIRLPKDLPINRRYGLLAQRKKFINTGAMSVEAFERFFFTIHKLDIKVTEFIKFCEPFHLSIVETLYLFASFSCQTSLILECRMLQNRTLNYKFEKMQLTTHYNGCAWFVLPKKCIWFAHQNGRIKASRYITREAEANIVEFLKPVDNYLILGLISDDIVYPLKIDSPQHNGNWHATRDFLSEHGYNYILRFDTTPIYKKAYFVMDNVNIFYKLCV